MSEELQNLEIFKEVQAEKFYQKKLEVTNGVMELGKILVETKERLKHGEWLKWLEDSRVNMTPRNCQRYMKIYNTFKNEKCVFLLSDLSLRNLIDLCQLPQEDREHMIESSESSEELSDKIKQHKKQRKNPTKAQVMSISARSQCKCEICNQSFKGMENILQIHHIDGNRENTIEENLIHLCPNCHSIVHNCSDINFISNDKLKELWLKVREVKLDNE